MIVYRGEISMVKLVCLGQRNRNRGKFLSGCVLSLKTLCRPACFERVCCCFGINVNGDLYVRERRTTCYSQMFRQECCKNVARRLVR